MASRREQPGWRILVAAGGTGGHLYPGIAVARCFQAACPGTDIAFLGRRGGLEERLVPGEGFPLYTVNVRSLQGRTKLGQLRSLGVLGIGTLQALRLLRRWRPHLVIGAGGYVMAPALLAAALLRLPRVIMEQNLVPGLTVRVLARYAQRVFTAFPESRDFLPEPQVVCTGTPIRPEIITQASDPSPDPTTRLNILVVGGSQGAHRLNQAVIEALPLLEAHSQQVSIVHQTGESDLLHVTEAYKGSPYHGRGPRFPARHAKTLSLGSPCVVPSRRQHAGGTDSLRQTGHPGALSPRHRRSSTPQRPCITKARRGPRHSRRRDDRTAAL